jgi:hypothetical protein
MVQQVLQVAEAIGVGIGVGEVKQHLLTSLDSDHLITENTAIFGLGPLGSWRISVRGSWIDNGGGICAKVSFLAKCIPFGLAVRFVFRRFNRT